jgi:hypothetical protein
MSRTLVLAALLLAGCSSAFSDSRAAPIAAPLAVSDSGPYGVEILGDDGRPLHTYQHDGRYYVLGDAGARYIVHVTNPTERRVEAVVTVDGLDVIDGEDGDLHKRGYIVPARGDLSIEGFRTSQSDVATFRFSSVDDSYAGRKGKARNVGVIAVALFDEAAAPVQQPVQIIQPADPAAPPPQIVDYGDRDEGAGAASANPNSAPRTATISGDTKDRVGGEDEPYMPHVPTTDPCCSENAPQPTHRGGLGTEYGEQRSSSATWTQFVRASDTPVAIAELRYNDAAGLAALGITTDTPVDPSELTKRETADPFPGDPSFAQPPR